MRPDTTPRRARQLLLAAIAVLLCTTGLVAGNASPASAAPKPARVKGVKLTKPRVDGTTASFKVRWKRAARATSYKVQWRTPGGKAHKDRTRTTSTTIKGLAQGTDYCVRVRAYNGKRKGKWSKTRCRTTARLAPVQPVWVDRQQVQGSTVTMTFRWNEVAGATSYDLDYLGNENPIQGAKNTKRVTVPGNGSGVASVTLGGFDPSRTYCFQVRPSGPAGVGAFATAGCKRTEPLSRATNGNLAVNMMTWNVCSGSGDNCDGRHPWDDRADAAKARVAAIGPDAVAFQESAPAINDLDDTPGYALGCRIGDGYPGDPVLGGSRNQSLIVKTSKFTIVPNSAGGIRFSGYTHGGCWVQVTDEVSGRQLVLASIHLAPPSQASDQTRANQAAVFWAAVSSAAGGLPVVIGGDFNSDRGSGWDGAREFLNSFGYDDAYDVAESYNALPYLNSFTEWSPVPRIFPRWGGHIDRVFVPPNARVTSWQTEEPYADGRWTSLLSDHAPVRVTVTIP